MGTAPTRSTLRPHAIGAGINIVHINTELRVAWQRGLEEGLSKEPEEVVPYIYRLQCSLSRRSPARASRFLTVRANPQDDPGDRRAIVAVLHVDAWRREARSRSNAETACAHQQCRDRGQRRHNADLISREGGASPPG
jgi:hypothetical protein